MQLKTTHMKLFFVLALFISPLYTVQAQTRAQGIAISYNMPEGWQVMKEDYGSILLGHQSIPGFILLQEHGYQGQEMTLAEMAVGVQEEGLVLQATSGISQLENGDYFAKYQGQAQGQNATAVAVCSLSSVWQVGGVMVLTLTTTEMFTPQHQELAIKLAQSITYHPFMDAQAKQWAPLVKGQMLVHQWSQSTGTTFTDADGSYGGENSISMSGREEVHLCSNGQFAIFNNDNASISMSGDSYGSFGGGRSNADQDTNQGLWVLMNINNTPVFRLLFADGSVTYHAVSDYQEGVLYIDDKKYIAAPSNRCQ